MFHYEMEVLSLWHMKFVFLMWTVGTGEAADLFMCREGRPTILFIKLLLRRGSRQDTPSLMTWMDTNRRAWAGWIWLFIKVQEEKQALLVCSELVTSMQYLHIFNVVYISLLKSVQGSGGAQPALTWDLCWVDQTWRRRCVAWPPRFCLMAIVPWVWSTHRMDKRKGWDG